MTTVVPARTRLSPTAISLVDRVLAGGALVMLAALAVALMRGWERLGELPALVAFHLVTIAAALILTPLLLLRRRGDRRHRQLGYAWVTSLGATAIASLFIRDLNGGFSPIHILSVVTLVGLFGIVTFARAHNVARHRAIVRQVTAGALLIAGFFTFVPSRTLGGFMFG